jgi:hypothetical protein
VVQLLFDSEAEIAKFENSIIFFLFNEDIVWFNVAMHDMLSGDKLDSSCELVDDL